ncbi:membrane protein [Salmonella enterica subsp. enterica]|uniref:Membrane protein n=1 Tax=Salmonella enterica I TaxID=59201 RepID=A0A379WDV4_SALET|nr:membrane protein [Salmonella enterica subsp. enterica]
MNYQFCWYLFCGINIFMVVLLCAFTFIDITASAAWLIILGLVYPVAVSMRLHILHQKKAVMLRQNSAEWIVYLQGSLCKKNKAR